MTKYPEFFAALAAPFKAREVKQLKKGKMISYVTARVVMNRLDEVVGPEGWWDDYIPGAESVICRLTITLPDGKEITKVDAGGYAGMSDSGDDDKSGFSDAFKRAAVKFGVSRYLYEDGVPDFANGGFSCGQQATSEPRPQRTNGPAQPNGCSAPRQSMPPPPPETAPAVSEWLGYISDRSVEAQARWQAAMEAEHVEPTNMAHPDFQMPLVHEINNHFVSHALKSGAIKQEDIAKDSKPNVRDSAKSKAALADLYRKAPKKIRERVDAYFLEKEQALRVKLGMNDLDLEPALAGPAREPGSDDGD